MYRDNDIQRSEGHHGRNQANLTTNNRNEIGPVQDSKRASSMLCLPTTNISSAHKTSTTAKNNQTTSEPLKTTESQHLHQALHPLNLTKTAVHHTIMKRVNIGLASDPALTHVVANGRVGRKDVRTKRLKRNRRGNEVRVKINSTQKQDGGRSRRKNVFVGARRDRIAEVGSVCHNHSSRMRNDLRASKGV